MKIRIKGNSIRVRLSRTEVNNFGALGYLEEHTEFGPTTLTYALECSNDIDALGAAYEDNKITMYVPLAMLSEWVATETVGYNGAVELGEGKKLSLLLEKDYQCIDNSSEDQSDNYINPNKVC